MLATVLGQSLAFGSRRVLDRFDVVIACQRFVSIVGRSGEGKSALLRLLAGLDAPDAGAVLVNGQAVNA